MSSNANHTPHIYIPYIHHVSLVNYTNIYITQIYWSTTPTNSHHHFLPQSSPLATRKNHHIKYKSFNDGNHYLWLLEKNHHSQI